MYLRNAIQILAQLEYSTPSISSGAMMYHTTSREAAEKIQEEGLKVGQVDGFFIDAGNWADEIYGARPIYLSADPEAYRRHSVDEFVTFKIDVSGLSLVADLPSLVDAGAYVDEDNKLIYWDDPIPDPVAAVLPKGEARFRALVNPNSPAAQAAIKITGTAAILEDIPPERIVNVI